MDNKFTSPGFDVNMMNKFYIMFKGQEHGYHFELDEWIEFMFEEWNLTNHHTMLKSNI